MKVITITIYEEESESEEEFAVSRESLIEYVVGLIGQGYTTGYDPYWTIEVEERE